MAVQYVNSGGGLLGTLGGLAQIGGMFIPGAQWLTPLGMGMKAVNGAMTGNPQSAAQNIGNIAKGVITGDWINPAGGNIAKAGDDTAVLDLFRRAYYGV